MPEESKQIATKINEQLSSSIPLNGNNDRAPIEFRSDAMQEILGRPPRWIIRSGITLLFCIILVLLIGSAFFRYPDVITSEVVITTKNPPSWVVARSSGKLQQLLVTDKQQVHVNDLLAIIDNPASYSHVQIVKRQLDSLLSFTHSFSKNALHFNEDVSLQLGELQDGYISLVKQMKDYLRFIELNFYSKKQQSLARELGGQQRYLSLLKRQHTLQEQDAELAEKQFQRQVTLFNEKVIPAQEYENAEKNILAVRKGIEQSNINLSNAEITIEKLHQSIAELSLEYEDKLQNMQLVLQNTYDQLKARLSIWEQQYVLQAKVDGVVSFSNVWSVNHQVNAGDKVFAIIPENRGAIIGKLQLPVAGAGKVKEGQNVNIKLDGYPYMEYGMVKGKVSSVALLPSDKLYMVELELPNGLKSFYKTSFELTGELTGVAEISTDEMSLFQRLFNPLKFLFRRNKL